jgi:pSer/pThr/pTyr-binding forkhead associated (FHA) protein
VEPVVEDDNGTLALAQLDVQVDLDDIDLEDAVESPLTPPTVSGEEEEPLIIYPEEKLRFQTAEGLSFAAGAGDIVGRAHTGSDVLENYPTVSRSHFSLRLADNNWFIKNLSDNGSWVNGQEVVKGTELALGPGDELKLSSRLTLKVLL